MHPVWTGPCRAGSVGRHQQTGDRSRHARCGHGQEQFALNNFDEQARTSAWPVYKSQHASLVGESVFDRVFRSDVQVAWIMLKQDHVEAEFFVSLSTRNSKTAEFVSSAMS